MAKLKLRKLKSKDLFMLTRFFRKIGVEEIIAEFTSKTDVDAEDGDAVEHRGAGIITKVATLVFDNIDKLESEVNALLADLTETDEETIQNLDLVEYGELITGLVQKEELKSFFSSFMSLSKLVPNTK